MSLLPNQLNPLCPPEVLLGDHSTSLTQAPPLPNQLNPPNDEHHRQQGRTFISRFLHSFLSMEYHMITHRRWDHMLGHTGIS